jgi:MscS family membrane protein
MKRKLWNTNFGIRGLSLAVFLLWGVMGEGQDTNRATQNAGATNVFSVGQTAAAGKVDSRMNEAFLTFGLDRIPLLQIQLFGNPLWQYIASLFYLFLAFYLSKFLDFLIRGRLKKWAEKTETKFDDYLIELVHGPIKVITFVILLHIGLQVFSWPEWVNAYLSKGLKIIVAASITYVGLKFVDILLSYWRERSAEADKGLNEQIHPILRKTSKMFIVVVAILVTSQNLGINITGILASFSVGALAVGLAAQDTLANLFGAVAIYLDRPFRIGDRIKLDGGVDGVVETIGLRSTQVRNLDGFLVTIPNKTMGNATITNVAQRPTIKTVLNLGLTYGTSTAQIKQALTILEDIFRQHPMTHSVTVTLNQFADSALNIEVAHWWKSTEYEPYRKGMQEFYLAIKQRFDEAGLAIAYPTRTIYLKQADGGIPATANPSSFTREANPLS